MDVILQADKIAFANGAGTDRASLANALVTEAGLRIDHSRRRGRGAGLNPSGRFETETRHVFDDGWMTLEELEPFKT